VYQRPDKYLLSGDIFADVPVPTLDPGLPLTARVDFGPALLIDADCSVCKPGGEAFNFAPLYPLAYVPNNDQGNVRRNAVRRRFFLAAHLALGGVDLYADLQQLFSLPRTLFAIVPAVGPDGTPRVEAVANTGINERVLSLDPTNVGLLKYQLVKFFDLGLAQAPVAP
jgi:hypothetical protein